MKRFFTFLPVLLAFAPLGRAQTVVGFENFALPPETYLNGSDGSGGFESGGVFLPNDYNNDWLIWSGWGISNTTDASTPGFTNEFSAIAGGGHGGSATYAVSYVFGSSKVRLQGSSMGKTVAGMYVTNNTYAYLSMRDGDAVAKKFGGIAGSDPDFLLLTAKAYHNGALKADSVNFYLADYRFSNNSQDYIIDGWTWMDLSGLGAVDSLEFMLTSSDVGAFGMNTPAYFCVDNLTIDGASGVAAVTGKPGLFALYPNPTADFIHVEHRASGVLECTLFNLGGKAVLHKRLAPGGGEMDLRHLPAGQYVVQLRDAGGEHSRLLVKW